jgi:hypothetical protein
LLTRHTLEVRSQKYLPPPGKRVQPFFARFFRSRARSRFPSSFVKASFGDAEHAVWSAHGRSWAVDEVRLTGFPSQRVR